MAASPVLVDSSFYIDLLRKGRDPLRALALPAQTRDLAVCGIIRCEVGRGIRSPEILKRFQSFWEVMIHVPTDNRLWDEAQRTLWNLDRTGTIIPLSDAVIACCARRINAVVLTYDTHFSWIEGVRVTDHLDV
jgi:predicted nucleic acid-binding protein